MGAMLANSWTSSSVTLALSQALMIVMGERTL